MMKRLSLKTSIPFVVIILLIVGGCATSNGSRQAHRQNKSGRSQTDSLQSLRRLQREVPNPVDNEIPEQYKQAIARQTRTKTGKPGPDYWQQQSDYTMHVRVLPKQKKLAGESTITYHNNSPDTLRKIYLGVTQDFHKKGVIRNRPAEITGGLHIRSLSYNGDHLTENETDKKTGYTVNGTVMKVTPGRPLLPGREATMKMNYDFKIPQKGAGGRMGYNGDNLFFLGYWYPKIRVYDDVIGWFKDPFLGNAEFYNEFGNYKVNITVPEQWIVAGTGRLLNAGEVLQKPVRQRMLKAHHSDSVMHVVQKKDFGHLTKSGANGRLTWKFTADHVSDFAFSVTRASQWDATRAPVGDRDGDGKTDYTNIDAFYRSSAPLWKHAARYGRNAIKHHSHFTGLSYPWPHMTAVEGGGIIGGGMEYPMMTLIGPYKNGSKTSLYAVIAHELGHMWVPMQLATDERRYAWMDEGTTTFNENQAKKAYFPEQEANVNQNGFKRYLQITKTDQEGEIMRRSDYHYSGAAYGVASYPKPASVLVTLRGLLGKKTFTKAYHTFMHRWQFKHPYPWDLFHTFEDVSGRDLGWFWRSWYYETWRLDQAVGKVRQTSDEARITINDKGQIPMPATVNITLANGRSLTRHIAVDTWLQGATQKVLHVDTNAAVTKVVIDPKHKYPDADRSNNTWKRLR